MLIVCSLWWMVHVSFDVAWSGSFNVVSAPRMLVQHLRVTFGVPFETCGRTAACSDTPVRITFSNNQQNNVCVWSLYLYLIGFAFDMSYLILPYYVSRSNGITTTMVRTWSTDHVFVLWLQAPGQESFHHLGFSTKLCVAFYVQKIFFGHDTRDWISNSKK